MCGAQPSSAAILYQHCKLQGLGQENEWKAKETEHFSAASKLGGLRIHGTTLGLRFFV